MKRTKLLWVDKDGKMLPRTANLPEGAHRIRVDKFRDTLTFKDILVTSKTARIIFEGEDGTEYYMSTTEFKNLIAKRNISFIGTFEYFVHGSAQSIGIKRPGKGKLK